MDSLEQQPSISKSSPRAKQAACLNCRRSKIKCIRGSTDNCCERCQSLRTECVIPDFHVGRQKGVKNKRKGLDKALHQIEQAIKKSKGQDEAQTGNAISNLQQLLNEAQGHWPRNRRDTMSSEMTVSTNTTNHQADNSTDDSLALDGAENPLQLLARASDLQMSPHKTVNEQPAPLATPGPSVSEAAMTKDGRSENKWFFAPLKAVADVGEDVDPIDMGLVTIEEANDLFSFFYQNLAHTRWGLDPVVHTFSFVRKQSAFLLTSVLSASALFIHSASAISKRLSTHCRSLAHRVMTQRIRSVEVVIAFMVNVPWMPPGEHSADDETCSYLATALAIAVDLSLNKIVLPSSSFDPEQARHFTKADCIDGRRALWMDGFEDVEHTSEWGRRLLRRRERAWIALFVLERGVCLARGRSYTVPITALLENCDRWHMSAIADSRDGPMLSIGVLRRDLDGLFKTVKQSCDNYNSADGGAEVAQLIRNCIESFYDQWFATWATAIGEGEQRTLPPYVEILVTHTRLSTYSGVINHPTASTEVKRVFRAAGLSSALNVMRAAIQGERKLKSMPNNTAIMISFAACFALSLSVTTLEDNSNLAPSIRNLIAETAGVLERIGATPSHRNGASVLYGKYLRDILSRVSELPSAHTSRVTPTYTHAELAPAPRPPFMEGLVQQPEQEPTIQQQTQYPQGPGPIGWSQPLQFSAMSDNQIIEAVNRAGAGATLELPLTNFAMNDMTGMDWLDWVNPPEYGF